MEELNFYKLVVGNEQIRSIQPVMVTWVIEPCIRL